MTQKNELLRFAALAMGPERVGRTDYSDKTPDHWIQRTEQGSCWCYWDPMESNSDALMLIAELDLWTNPIFLESLKRLTTETDFGKMVCVRWAATNAASEIGKAIQSTGIRPTNPSILDAPHNLLKQVLDESDSFVEGEANRGNFVTVSPAYEAIRLYLHGSVSQSEKAT